MNQANNRVQSSEQSIYDEEIDLLELLWALWRGKWIIVVTTFVAAVFSVLYALSLPNIYRAEVLLAPTDRDESGSLGSLSSRYSGLANIAGINLGGLGGGVDKTALGIEVLQSRRFIGEFVTRHNIIVPLLAAEDWKLKGNRLIYDDDIYDIEEGEWKRNVVPPSKAEPSLLEAHEAFRKTLNVSQDPETGFVRLSIEHYSPYIAEKWVRLLVEDINVEIKRQDVEEAEKSILYLSEQLKSTSLADLQTVFYQLIEEQTKTIMLAKVRPEYLFRTVDPAVVMERKSKPDRTLIAALGTIFGCVLGVIFVFGRHLLVRSER